MSYPGNPATHSASTNALADQHEHAIPESKENHEQLLTPTFQAQMGQMLFSGAQSPVVMAQPQPFSSQAVTISSLFVVEEGKEAREDYFTVLSNLARNPALIESAQNQLHAFLTVDVNLPQILEDVTYNLSVNVSGLAGAYFLGLFYKIAINKALETALTSFVLKPAVIGAVSQVMTFVQLTPYLDFTKLSLNEFLTLDPFVVLTRMLKTVAGVEGIYSIKIPGLGNIPLNPANRKLKGIIQNIQDTFNNGLNRVAKGAVDNIPEPIKQPLYCLSKTLLSQLGATVGGTLTKVVADKYIKGIVGPKIAALINQQLCAEKQEQPLHFIYMETDSVHSQRSRVNLLNMVAGTALTHLGVKAVDAKEKSEARTFLEAQINALSQAAGVGNLATTPSASLITQVARVPAAISTAAASSYSWITGTRISDYTNNPTTVWRDRTLSKAQCKAELQPYLDKFQTPDIFYTPIFGHSMEAAFAMYGNDIPLTSFWPAGAAEEYHTARITKMNLFILAARENHVGLVEALLELGIDPNIGQDGISALHIAILLGHNEIVHRLLDHPATNLEARAGLSGLTPLATAAFCGNLQAAEWLLFEKRLSANSAINYGLSTLHCAIKGLSINKNRDQKIAIIGLLLKSNARVSTLDTDGKTAFDHLDMKHLSAQQFQALKEQTLPFLIDGLHHRLENRCRLNKEKGNGKIDRITKEIRARLELCHRLGIDLRPIIQRYDLVAVAFEAKDYKYANQLVGVYGASLPKLTPESAYEIWKACIFQKDNFGIFLQQLSNSSEGAVKLVRDHVVTRPHILIEAFTAAAHPNQIWVLMGCGAVVEAKALYLAIWQYRVLGGDPKQSPQKLQAYQNILALLNTLPPASLSYQYPGNGWTVLHLAIDRGLYGLVEPFIVKNTDLVSIKDSSSLTPLEMIKTWWSTNFKIMNSLTSTAEDGSDLTIDQVLCFLCLPAYLNTPNLKTENTLRYYLKESLTTRGTGWLDYIKGKTVTRPEFVQKLFSVTEDPDQYSLLYHAVKNRRYPLAKNLIENYDARDLVDALDHLDGCLWKGLTPTKRAEFDDMHAYLVVKLAVQCPQTEKEEAKFKTLFFKYLHAGKKEVVKILLGNPYYDFSSFKDAQSKTPLEIISSWWTANEYQNLSLAIIARNAKPTLPRTLGPLALPQPTGSASAAPALPAPAARPALTFSPEGTASSSARAASDTGAGPGAGNGSIKPSKPTGPRPSVSAATAPPKPPGPRPGSQSINK